MTRWHDTWVKRSTYNASSLAPPINKFCPTRSISKKVYLLTGIINSEPLLDQHKPSRLSITQKTPLLFFKLCSKKLIRCHFSRANKITTRGWSRWTCGTTPGGRVGWCLLWHGCFRVSGCGLTLGFEGAWDVKKWEVRGSVKSDEGKAICHALAPNPIRVARDVTVITHVRIKIS